MEVDFIPLDYEHFEHNGRSYAKIIGRNSAGKRICLIDKCDIYFWAILKKDVSDKKAEEIVEKIKKIKEKNISGVSSVEKAELKEKNFLGEKVKAIKIYTKSQKDNKIIAGKIKFKEISALKEQDLNYVTRYIIESQLIPMQWHLINAEVVNSEEFGGIDSSIDVDLCIKVNSIKAIKHHKTFLPKIIAFDIESDEFEIGKGEILMISLYGEKTKKVFTWKKCSKLPDYVECYANEKEMLNAFTEEIKKISPDVLVGYFSDKFDLPYLKARAEKNKVKLSLGLDNSQPKFSGGMNPKGKIDGIVHIDLLKFIEVAYSQYLQSETLGLNDVSSELLGEGKKEHEFKHSSKMGESEWKEFFEYNLHDSALTYRLVEKLWADIEEFSRVMQEPLFDATRDGMSANVENYIIHNLSKFNEIIEEKPEHDEIEKRRRRQKYEGAFVLQPVPKLYENIVMFDFTSYWPSIISTFNLSRSTYLGEIKKPDSVEIDSGKRKLYFKKQKGFFPEMLEEIIEKRKQYKEEYKKNPSPILKARSNAFKLLANASYGYQGFFGARYYCPEASEATTAVSRDFIKKVIKDSEKEGFKAIYSDTDSICLELGKKTKSQALEFLKKINSELPGIMELELEDFYKRGIWVTTRGGEIGAKKKYALINEKGKMKIRGFETIRRDWCQLARELQNKVLEKILREGNEKSALEYTKEIIKKIKSRNIEKKQLIIRTQLRKPLSEYKAETPHVAMAKKMLEAGIPISQGMLIEYYIAESSNKKALKREKVVFPEENKLYDIEYYLTKQVLPSIENIFQVFGIHTEDIIKGSKQKTLV